MSYTGRTGEAEFESDFIRALQDAGWGEVLKHPTVDDLIENWRSIIFARNRAELNSVPLSNNEMDELLTLVSTTANTPVKANEFLQTAGGNRKVAILRDKDSADTVHAGKEVYLDLFSSDEIAGGRSRYQIAEQTVFNNSDVYKANRGDVTLLINGMPLIHIELKASGVSALEACEQIKRYTQEGNFKGFMGLVQVFFAITPEDALYFANPGDVRRFNDAFFFRWGDRDNRPVTDWKQLIQGRDPVLSLPEAHKLIGYYTIADEAKDTLKVCRSYQYAAIKAIVKRTAEQKWGDHDQKGGFIWCTTGGGKTMTSFKAGQMIIDLSLADKVVFVVDRKSLDEQSAGDYESFMREGEHIVTTRTTRELFNRLKSDSGDASLIITSIQKLSRINKDAAEAKKFDERVLEKIANKRIVFIIDEAHRSQFGDMHQNVENTFYNALMFGFTGTPILSENLKEGEQTTESVFGSCLAVYSLASGIKDRNVLGFAPSYVRTLNYDNVREIAAIRESGAVDVLSMTPEQRRKYINFKRYTPTVTEYDKDGKVKRRGLEEYLSDADYDTESHRAEVVEDITSHFSTYARGNNGDHTFHGILATTSIPEACAYWKQFHDTTNLHVTALFDMNTNINNESTLIKNQYIPLILDNYNQMFGTAYDIRSDNSLADYKKDIVLRLAHKKPYEHIGGSSEVLDLVIVVDQLLTGFDSQFVNVIYLDKVLQDDNLIQAISRTNRVYNDEEKPFGIVKFYRKPETMKKYLDDALKLYCQGDENGVKVEALDQNIQEINRLYASISQVFRHDHIKDFEQLPRAEADRQKFRKDFSQMKSRIKASFLQGFEWNSAESGGKLDFGLSTYQRLKQRFEDAAIGRSGLSHTKKMGTIYDTNLSSIEGDKIDADYLETRFRILTISDLARDEKEDAISDIRNHLGDLPENLQKYAKQIMADIESGALEPENGKKLRTYISEYRERAVRTATRKEAEELGVDGDMFFDLYESWDDSGSRELKLKELKATADRSQASSYFGCSPFAALGKLNTEIKSYIEGRKAEND